MYRKINESKTFYNRQKLEEDFNKSVTYMKQICEFPLIDCSMMKNNNMNTTKLNEHNRSKCTNSSDSYSHSSKFGNSNCNL